MGGFIFSELEGYDIKGSRGNPCFPFGPLAQLVEHLICNERVAGSNPVRSTKSENRRASVCFLLFCATVQDSKDGGAKPGVSLWPSRGRAKSRRDLCVTESVIAVLYGHWVTSGQRL